MGSKEGNYIERYWRDATPDDAIKEPPMVARFRDDGDNGWLAADILLYHDRSMHPWHNKDGISYEHCQVYDAPEPKYVPFTWEDRDELRGRWIIQVGDENAEQMINKMDFNHGEFYANNKCARQLLNGWLFLDTGEPVGKRVV